MLRSTVVVSAVIAVVTSAVSVHAADREKAVEVAAALTPPATVWHDDVDWSLPPVRFGGESRGGVLPTLYASLAVLNAFDAYTTSKGLSMGAAEANPMMRALAGRPAALWAVKGGVTAGSIVVAERLWRKNNKVGAIAVMLATNGMMATVAARNSGVLRQVQAR